MVTVTTSWGARREKNSCSCRSSNNSCGKHNVFPVTGEAWLSAESTHGANTDLHVLQSNDHRFDHRGMLHVVVDGFAQRAFVNGEQRLNPRGVLRLSCQICVVALH